MTTKLTIYFDRRALGAPAGADGYYLHTRVEVTQTLPDEIEPCLVFSVVWPSPTQEQIIRVATLAEMSSIPAVTVPFTTFKAASLNGIVGKIQVGDVIRVTAVPVLWGVMGYTVPTDYTVNNKVSDTEVEVSSAFPSYMEDIQFEVLRGGSPELSTQTDGYAERTYVGIPAAEYRAKEHYDLFSDLASAQAMFDSLKGAAQSLVDEWNEDHYSGVSTEVFE